MCLLFTFSHCLFVKRKCQAWSKGFSHGWWWCKGIWKDCFPPPPPHPPSPHPPTTSTFSGTSGWVHVPGQKAFCLAFAKTMQGSENADDLLYCKSFIYNAMFWKILHQIIGYNANFLRIWHQIIGKTLHSGREKKHQIVVSFLKNYRVILPLLLLKAMPCYARQLSYFAVPT